MTAQELKAHVRQYLADNYPDGPACESATVVIDFGNGITPETLVAVVPTSGRRVLDPSRPSPRRTAPREMA